MNAEALIGTVLGTCTLQKLIGQGGMGAVYLAQQSRPRRQVAVKVLLPMVPLSPHQLAAFLERFRRETDAAASLEHPNITPVHEYGERGGIAYLVMPYIGGGTLRDEMEGEGQLPLPKTMNYLDQMAAALDFAHEHGVIHRDIKPANILMTPEGRLLLTDFGLVKIVSDGPTPQMRLTGAGAPVGTPDYMAPEQVIGEEVDGRADIYSLGVILYQMITGTTPFQGETPMQIAAQHLQVPPPAPRLYRPDLPAAAEKVMLKALEKLPGLRYASAQEMADAFRASLIGAGVQLNTGMMPAVSALSAMTGRYFTPKGLLDSTRQAGTASMIDRGVAPAQPTGAVPGAATGAFSATNNAGTQFGGGGLLSRTGKFPLVGNGTGLLPATSPANVLPTAPVGDTNGTAAFPRSGGLLSSYTARLGAIAPPRQPAQASPALNATTEALKVSAQQTDTNGVKLTGPVKVLQIPVAGQPGRFMTGVLPAAPPQVAPAKKGLKPWVKVTGLILAVLVVLLGAGGIYWFLRFDAHQAARQPLTATGQGSANGSMLSAQARATATAQANIILSDPLSRNIHNWLTSPPDIYAFKDGAYHITDRGNSGRATVLQAGPFMGPMGYSLTMEEINGNDTSPNNSFGMIFRFNQQTQGGKTVTRFYTFEVVNMKGGEYQFWKYDDSKGQKVSPWMEIWHQPFTSVFHYGHGPQSVNTFKVFMDGNNFTFIVNGKTVKMVQDNALASGTVGMIVNMNGTEVAFSNLLLTHN
jgi:hypothetical protein